MGFGFTVIFQLAVEIYPPTSSAVGGALVIGMGRVGGIVAPELFDYMLMATGMWETFFYVQTSCCIVALIFWYFASETGGRRDRSDNAINRSMLGTSGYNTMSPMSPKL